MYNCRTYYCSCAVQGERGDGGGRSRGTEREAMRKVHDERVRDWHRTVHTGEGKTKRKGKDGVTDGRMNGVACGWSASLRFARLWQVKERREEEVDPPPAFQGWAGLGWAGLHHSLGRLERA